MIGGYIPSGQGTVDTIRLQDGRTVRVSAVDGESPYIVTRSNPAPHVEFQQVRDRYLSQLNLVLETTDLDPNTKARIRAVYVNQGKESRGLFLKVTQENKVLESEARRALYIGAGLFVGAGALIFSICRNPNRR